MNFKSLNFWQQLDSCQQLLELAELVWALHSSALACFYLFLYFFLLFFTFFTCLTFLTFMSCYVMSCYVMSCHVMSCHVLLCHVTSCNVMWCHVISCYVMSCHVDSWWQLKPATTKVIMQMWSHVCHNRTFFQTKLMKKLSQNSKKNSSAVQSC